MTAKKAPVRPQPVVLLQRGPYELRMQYQPAREAALFSVYKDGRFEFCGESEIGEILTELLKDAKNPETGKNIGLDPGRVRYKLKIHGNLLGTQSPRLWRCKSGDRNE